MGPGLTKIWLIFCLIFTTFFCTTETNLGEWGKWSVCSKSCGGGTQSRNRTCAGCIETRTCNDRTCRIGTKAMIGVVTGVCVSIFTIILIFLVGIFFIKEANDNRKTKRSSILESTPGASRRTRTGTVDSSLDIKLNVIRHDQDPSHQKGSICMVTST